jgi:hypothetical protein
MRNAFKIVVGTPKERDQLGKVDVDVRIILKWILRTYLFGC